MGFFNFLKKSGVVKAGGQTWKGDAKDRPLDDDEQRRQLSDPDNKIEHIERDDDSSASDSFSGE